MDISTTRYNITFRDGLLWRNGRKLINTEKLIHEISMDCKELSILQVEDIVSNWMDRAAKSTKENVNEIIKEAVENSTILDGFTIIQNTRLYGMSQLLHYINDSTVQFICNLPAAKKDILQMFRTIKPKEFQELKELLAPYLRPKLSITLDDETVADVILNAGAFYTDTKYRKELDNSIKPITLNNEHFAYHNINIEFNDKPELNPTLKEFLGRVSNHEHLCAILWLMFNGIKTPYVVYLHGGGGDGKSSFINMLCRIVKHYGALELDGLFKYFHVFGKALITLTENTDTYLMQSKMIKEITGSSPVSCQEKGKSSFTSTIDGLLIVDSNNKLKLVGEDYEFRRLRYFFVAPTAQGTDKVNPEIYVNKLCENPNEFINYCKLCYEKVGRNNLVEASLEMQQQTYTLVDSYHKYNFEQACIKMGLTFGEEYELTLPDFYKIFDSKVKNKDRFFLDNFKNYLRLTYNVVEYPKALKGLQSNLTKNKLF